MLKLADLIGYRTRQEYIRSSTHIPLDREAVRDALSVLFGLLKGDADGAIRAILSHFFFVYIHPHMEGNGRIGRFFMNGMLVTGGYNWIVIPVEKRSKYASALEKASVEEDISDFMNFIVSLI